MEKIKEIINKLLGKPSGSDSSDNSSGFTLIELLIVIAVIGILAAALLIAIDPIDKIRAGNDTKVLNDTRSIYDAYGRYYTSNYVLPGSGTSPASSDWEADLTGSGELKQIPSAPGGYDTGYVVVTSGDDYVVYGDVKSKNNLEKAGTGVTSAYYVATGGGGCFMDSGSTPTATTVPNSDGSGSCQ